MRLSPAPFRFEDDLIPFDHGKRNGYYQVGDRFFIWKMLAYSEAARTRQKVIWHFHDEVWQSTDWKHQPALSLPALYRVRAEQLRQKYDYIILAWSGGADSTTILDTFLLNDIRLDEVVVTWAVKVSYGRYSKSARDTSAENFGSEWDYAIRPRLEWMHQNRPDIRVTVADWSDDMIVDDDSENLLKVTSAYNYTGFLRGREIDKIVTERSVGSSRVGLVLGIEPAKTEIINDQYLATFFVDWFSENRTSIGPDGTPKHVEFFYWTPDLPEICVAQCHELLRFLRTYPLMKQYLARTTVGRDGSYTEFHAGQGGLEPDRLIKKVLFYPNYDARTFQAKKNLNHFRANQYDWLYSNPHFQELNHIYGGVVNSFCQHLREEDFLIRNGEKATLAIKRSRSHVIGSIDPEHAEPQDRARYLKQYQLINELLPYYL